MLKSAGHKVTTAFEVNLAGMPDYDVLMHAIKTKHILFTQNCEDFISLSEAIISSGGNYSGIIVLHKNNNQKKDMSYSDIVKAIDNLIKIGVSIPNAMHRLNQYNF